MAQTLVRLLVHLVFSTKKLVHEKSSEPRGTQGTRGDKVRLSNNIW
jgi:hypothetical protein